MQCERMKELFQLKLIFIVLHFFAKYTDERLRGKSTYGDDDDDTLVRSFFSPFAEYLEFFILIKTLWELLLCCRQHSSFN